MTLKKADLHLHSSASYDVGNKTLTPEYLFGYAMGVGMDYFTLTDHDTMDGIRELYEIFGEDDPRIISGIEFTVQRMKLPYPVNGYLRVPFRTHLNIFNLTFEDYRIFQTLDQSLDAYYEYCDHILAVENRLIYIQYNHPFWYFERDRQAGNTDLSKILIEISRVNEINQDVPHNDNVVISRLSHKHNRGLSGGSDSHSGNVGWYHTLAPGNTKEEFLQNIMEGRSQIGQLENGEFSFLNLNGSYLSRFLKWL